MWEGRGGACACVSVCMGGRGERNGLHLTEQVQSTETALDSTGALGLTVPVRREKKSLQRNSTLPLKSKEVWGPREVCHNNTCAVPTRTKTLV